VLDDHRAAGIPAREVQLLDFVRRLNRRPHETTEEEIAALRDAGWSDEAIYDAISVCAAFNFLNRWVDGSGVEPLSERACRAAARELAEDGYIQQR